jgi:hypothetical protein
MLVIAAAILVDGLDLSTVSYAPAIQVGDVGLLALATCSP